MRPIDSFNLSKKTRQPDDLSTIECFAVPRIDLELRRYIYRLWKGAACDKKLCEHQGSEM